MISKVIKDFAEVFNEPKELPLHRSYDLSIRLKKGDEPVCIRPYRYGILQKNIIERLTQEMLDVGVIQASNSPFSS